MMQIGRSALFFSFLLLTLGAVLFQVKYTVLDLENAHRRLHHQIEHEHEAIHILKAEWAYLNDPARLQALAKKYLKLSPISGAQLVPYADLQNSGLGEYDRSQLNTILQRGTPTKEPNKGKKGKV